MERTGLRIGVCGGVFQVCHIRPGQWLLAGPDVGGHDARGVAVLDVPHGGRGPGGGGRQPGRGRRGRGRIGAGGHRAARGGCGQPRPVAGAGKRRTFWARTLPLSRTSKPHTSRCGRWMSRRWRATTSTRRRRPSVWLLGGRSCAPSAPAALRAAAPPGATTSAVRQRCRLQSEQRDWPAHSSATSPATIIRTWAQETPAAKMWAPETPEATT